MNEAKVRAALYDLNRYLTDHYDSKPFDGTIEDLTRLVGAVGDAVEEKDNNTPDRQADRERAAREWLIANGFSHRSNGQLTASTCDVANLVAFIASREAVVLEEVWQKAMLFDETITDGRDAIRQLEVWLRQQAKERGA